ncbi:hypothetical protein FRB96_009299 [Tulasnella sp. 330]|nr:hypothetical protein FRB96_009299 [Tulasnella sp. 330]
MSEPVSLLLPAFHINHSRPTRHCNDSECFIRSPLSENDRWRAFDAFDPRDLDDYGYGFHPAASLSNSDSRKMKRISEIRARAKERLMPPYPSSQRVTTTTVTTRRASRPSSSGPKASTTSSGSTLLAPPVRERILRTPSPVGWDCENDAIECTPCGPQTPKTPIHSRRHLNIPRTPLGTTQTPQTPASTVGSPSPLGTPPVLFFRSSSPL